MKKIILIGFSIILGVILFGQILGNDSSSLKSAAKMSMERQIDNLKSIP